MESLILILTNIYGYNDDRQNRILLEKVTEIISDFKALCPGDFVLIGGDWNMTSNEWVDRMPPRLERSQKNDIVHSLMADNGLTDIWRSLNPRVKSYLWFKPNGECKSRIDSWLGSNIVLNSASQSKISKAPLTDHCFIDLILESTRKEIRNKGYWKFNARLLQNEEYCAKIRELLKENDHNSSFESHVGKWEFIKFKIRHFSIQFSKELIKKKRGCESKLLKDINLYCNKSALNPEEKNKLMELQTKLDDLCLDRAHGAFVRFKGKMD